MGYDISYHPVDPALIYERVIPFVTGERDIDDLIESGTRIARNRYIANGWGLGVSRLHSKRFEKLQVPKKSLIDRFFNRPTPPPQIPPAAFEFETDLFIWGRPFFITVANSSDVSRAIDQYLAIADDETVNVLAKQMIENIEPGLSAQVSPDLEAGMPNNVAFRESFTWRLQLFRKAFAALSAGDEVTSPDGELHDPLELFANDFPLTAISFASHFRPGWMTRGYVWPTHLIKEAGLEVPLFSDAGELFRPLSERESRITFELRPTIEQNYSLGGYVAPKDVPRLRAFLESNHSRLLAMGGSQDWEYECALVLKKLSEAVQDAEARGLGFLEASEVYSGPLGIMN